MIFPGQVIATTEEAEAAKGAVEEQGTIYAAVVGVQEMRSGQALVLNPKTPRPLAGGDIVLCRVEDVFDQVAMLSFFPVDSRVASAADRAFLRITEVKGRGGGYVENFKEVMRIGDVVKAKIIEVTPLGVYVTIAERDLGVLKAFCSSCRLELDANLECKNQQCKNYSRKERRKMANG